jgi:hypothetical protein
LKITAETELTTKGIEEPKLFNDHHQIETTFFSYGVCGV